MDLEGKEVLIWYGAYDDCFKGKVVDTSVMYLVIRAGSRRFVIPWSNIQYVEVRQVRKS